MQDGRVDLVRYQGRHVFAGDGDEIHFFRIDLGRTQDAAAEQVGKAARLLNTDALALEVGHGLDIAAHHQRGFKLRQIGGQRLHGGAVGAADDGRRAGGQPQIDIAGEQRAIDLHTVAERNDVDVETGLLIEAEFLGDDHRHVDDIGRRCRDADGDLGLRAGRTRQRQHCDNGQKPPARNRVCACESSQIFMSVLTHPTPDRRGLCRLGQSCPSVLLKTTNLAHVIQRQRRIATF